MFTTLFAFSALQNSDKVGLLLFSDQIELFVPPKKGKRHILRLIRELVAFEPKRTKTNIALGLETLLKVLKHQGIVVLISDFLAPVAQFERPFKLAAKKFDLIPIKVQDKLEYQLPRVPVCISAVDPETGETDELCLSDGELNKQLRDFEQKQHKELSALFTPFKIEPIVADTAKPLADPVIAFFKRRAKKIRK